MSLDLRCPLCGKAGIPSEYIYWIHVHCAHLRIFKRSLQAGFKPRPGRKTCAYCGRGVNLRAGMWIFDRLKFFHARCWFRQQLEKQLAK